MPIYVIPNSAAEMTGLRHQRANTWPWARGSEAHGRGTRRHRRDRRALARREARAAFTLIELLVVIAIISLLMSLLLPSLRRAKRQALLAKCGVNMKQVALAEVAYATENNDYMAGYAWLDGEGGWETITEAVALDTSGHPPVLGRTSRAPNGASYPIHPAASHQHLFNLTGHMSGYVWCEDLTHQRTLEDLTPYKHLIRPLYNIPYDTARHAPCSKWGWGGYTQARRSAFDVSPSESDPFLDTLCPHLMRFERLQSGHLLLGEQWSRRHNWPVGYGYGNSALPEYVFYQVAFRHPGPRANFLFVDQSVRTWDWVQWGDHLDSARSMMGYPE